MVARNFFTRASRRSFGWTIGSFFINSVNTHMAFSVRLDFCRNRRLSSANRNSCSWVRLETSLTLTLTVSSLLTFFAFHLRPKTVNRSLQWMNTLPRRVTCWMVEPFLCRATSAILVYWVVVSP